MRNIWRIENRAGRFGPRNVEALEFVPAVRTRTESADLAARINWYLPAHVRHVDVFVDGAEQLGEVTAGDAWYMAPELVRNPGWRRRRPGRSKRLTVVHRATWRTLLRYVFAPHRTLMVDAAFAYASDEGWFSLARRFAQADLPSPEESIARLQELARPGASVLALATGPTAKLLDPNSVTQELRVTCNSAVRDHELLRDLRPDVIAFGDPVFHYGPSKYAAAFRADLRKALESTNAWIVTTDLFVEPLLWAMPEIRDRLIILSLQDGGRWRWPTPSNPTTRPTGNVLTNLMLPVAFALGDDVAIAGCDGRDPNETYYWKHNERTQYSDEFMRSAFEAHDAFFRFRDYADYYDEHCEQLEQFLATAEAAGKRPVGLTPSHIPALRTRGAADLASTS